MKTALTIAATCLPFFGIGSNDSTRPTTDADSKAKQRGNTQTHNMHQTKQDTPRGDNGNPELQTGSADQILVEEKQETERKEHPQDPDKKK
jgi:hypothetical protein